MAEAVWPTTLRTWPTMGPPGIGGWRPAPELSADDSAVATFSAGAAKMVQIVDKMMTSTMESDTLTAAMIQVELRTDTTRTVDTKLIDWSRNGWLGRTECFKMKNQKPVQSIKDGNPYKVIKTEIHTTYQRQKSTQSIKDRNPSGYNWYKCQKYPEIKKTRNQGELIPKRKETRKRKKKSNGTWIKQGNERRKKKREEEKRT